MSTRCMLLQSVKHQNLHCLCIFTITTTKERALDITVQTVGDDDDDNYDIIDDYNGDDIGDDTGMDKDRRNLDNRDATTPHKHQT